MPSETACKGCGLTFSSRNKVFKHLNDTDGACLSKEDYVDFCQFVRQLVNEKVMILYGYLPIQNIIRNGSDAATILINAMKLTIVSLFPFKEYLCLYLYSCIYIFLNDR